MTSRPEIPLFKVFLPPEEALMPRLRDVLYSGQISEGQCVYSFEQRFGEFVGSPNMLSCYSGTAALHLALVLAGVKTGDEVISTAMTAEPTNMAIRHSGAEVVWADVDPKNGNLDPNSIATRITPRTKAVVVVHYGGIPASMNAIRHVAEQNGIVVVEDVAHALGATYDGRMLGTHSEYGMFSFQAIKHLTTVDGGMLSCRSEEDLPRGRAVRWFGIDRRVSRTNVDVQMVGYKYHMNNVNATIGLVQLEHIRPVLGRHIENGEYFDQALTKIPGLELCTWDSGARPSYWFYTVLADRRDDLSRYLTERRIGNSQAHKRNDWHSVFADSRCDLPGLDEFYARMLHIPCGWWVTDEQREEIAEMIRKGW
jgi:dTDP-4-amino-4,6-dideoxygalactose transaminase